MYFSINEKMQRQQNVAHIQQKLIFFEEIFDSILIVFGTSLAI